MKNVAYSYIRFSTPEQAKGDSLRRQTEAAADWCKRNGITLDTSRTLHDLGKIAFVGAHRTNPDRNALAAFLKMVEQGKIARGSFLLVESLDRLTREHIRPALTLVLNLIEAGISVVQLKPVEVVYDANVEPMTLMMALMELSRGNSESAMKSERVGKAWAQKKELARQGKPQPGKGRTAGMACMTHKLPAWIEEKGGTLHLIPSHAKLVRRIFHLAAAGYSASSIVKLFRAEGAPPMGALGGGQEAMSLRSSLTGAPWVNINHETEAIDRTANRFRITSPPSSKNRNGTPPAPLLGRALPPTRITDRVNLFTGLLIDARDGRLGYFRSPAGAEETRCHRELQLQGRARAWGILPASRLRGSRPQLARGTRSTRRDWRHRRAG